MTGTQIGLFERHCNESAAERRMRKQSRHVFLPSGSFRLLRVVLCRMNELWQARNDGYLN
jgi:hypothetical protein